MALLLTNMAPQKPKFNRGIWKELEQWVRDLSNKYVEVYAISGPIFDMEKKVTVIGQDDTNEVIVPVPHAFFKSILAEKTNGNLAMWPFIVANKESDKPLSDFLCKTMAVELRAGPLLWNQLKGEKSDRWKNRMRRMW